jgi:hypothetical protein
LHATSLCNNRILVVHVGCNLFLVTIMNWGCLHCGYFDHNLWNICQTFMFPSMVSMLLQVCWYVVLTMHFGLLQVSSLLHITNLPPYATIMWSSSFLQLQSSNRITIPPKTQWLKNCMWLVFAIHEPIFICARNTPWPT